MIMTKSRGLSGGGRRLLVTASSSPLSLAVGDSAKHHSYNGLSSSSFSTMAAAQDVSSNNKNDKTVSMPSMFCRQCEQTADNFACTSVGICGKTPETAASQDALLAVVQSVSLWCQAARKQQQPGTTISQDILDKANSWTLEATFATLTNVNFSEERCAEYGRQGLAIRAQLQAAVGATEHAPMQPAAHVLSSPTAAVNLEDWEAFGLSVSVPNRAAAMNHKDAFAWVEMATYGLKGVCAYALHAAELNKEGKRIIRPDIMQQIHDVWSLLATATTSGETADEPTLKHAALHQVGKVSLEVLEWLDTAHAEQLGTPQPTAVRTTAVEGKAILVSGHDMKDLQALLEQTVGTGINVYTHGEMLPAHAYPELGGKYKHLVGNYGTAWQNQKFEFAAFPGPIVVTTNCVLEPRRPYRSRLYTMNATGVDHVDHIQNRNFSKVIGQALDMKGFLQTVEPARYVTTGYNHRAVLANVQPILDAVQKGDLKHVFLIGGCDGSQWDRSYFTDLAEETPNDSLLLTLGCAKNRLIHSTKLTDAKLPGDSGLPRLLDMGQCNDSYSAVVVAQALAQALNCSVNELPLTIALSHLEQKAAAVLLALLHLGVQNVRLGPSLPAYLTPNVLQTLQQEYSLKPIGEVEDDLADMLAPKTAAASS